ncbi:hypothetical protein POL68_27510 [Stigmatella sp. ncwal1]|uniref:Uncharacterized protein n=1 Tax=Stigmatella ashevillensis TaxID=2995309 RepID=A0ABT5DIS5_9BACT|nr:hypothetical protein [Stigmatella ashevillena]MDC0712246.1 hypothetical protein [Stigmatella ashevillena]
MQSLSSSEARAGKWTRVLVGAAVLLLWGLLTARATQVLGPQTLQVPLYNSDGAIPVMMCNADGWSFFDVYYYGQDRFGGWPFLAARAVGHLLGFTWTPLSLHAWLTLWLLGGALVMGALSRGFRLLGAGLYTAVLLVNPELRGILFELAQVYPWQMTALLLAWWSLRRDHERGMAHAGSSPPRRSARLLRARTFLLVFLAIWTSTVSVPLLLLLASVEAVRAHLLAPEPFPGRRSWRCWGQGLLLIGSAAVLEGLIRIAYLRYAKSQFGLRHRTHLTIDWDFLGQNARVVASTLWSSPSFPWLVLGTVGACGAALFLWRSSRTRAPREVLLLEGAVLVLATWSLAAVHAPLLTVLEHVRGNEYANRYFAPMYLFGSFSGALTVALGVGMLPGLARVRRRALALLGATALAGSAWALPAPAQSPAFLALQDTARRLEQRKPGTPLLGSYWSTYVMRSLQGEGALIPLPHEHEYRRTVWWERGLKTHAEVLVEHLGFPASGTAEAPEPWIFQYGTLLRLEQPRWETGAGRTFSLYRNALAEGQPHTVAPAIAQWNLCMPGTSVTLEFPPRSRALVMVALKGATPPVEITAEPLAAEGSKAPAAPFPLRAVDRLHHGVLDGGGAMLRGVRLTVLPGRTGKPTDWICGAEASFVFDAAGTGP